MNARCPGQDSRKITVEIHTCPRCRTELELFSDEAQVRCHRCGEIMRRESTPSCADWCPAAKQCLGEERWRSLKGEKMEGSKDAGTKNR